MKKNINSNKITEDLIIHSYLKKLNLNKYGTFNFKNDGAYIKLKQNKKLVLTTDSISEDIDFFKNDEPMSIAKKIMTINLSDLSAMGVMPHSYLLNLFLPKYIDINWIKKFTSALFKIQKKYNFYLLGGDLSTSKKLTISATFLGHSSDSKIVSQNSIQLNDDIWITGNIGDSYIGLQILKNNIKVSKSLKNFFLKKYYYPNNFIFGHNLRNHVNSMKDISDGLIGDLKKMLDGKYGAKINLNLIPISLKLNRVLNTNNLSKNYIMNCGDDYELILISNNKNRIKIKNISKKYNFKITRIGKVIKNLEIIDDSNNLINIPREFDHFR